MLTTNFDPLFERARKRLKAHIAPHLPRVDCQQLEGVTYLHGRASLASETALNLVLSTSDFGRAYMAQGWATEFMREALRRFIVVLVGYSADDPPVNYLLRGMRGLNLAKPIYAFAQETGPEVRARWRERNVEALPYRAIDQGHSGLWTSLHAWAESAADPEGWRRGVVAMAKRGPRALKSHERGQVVSLIKTEPGARALLGSASEVSAEWLYVFDPVVRRAETGMLGRDGEEKFDPRPFYGLDDDPEERLKRDARLVIAHDLLSAQPSDGEAQIGARLSGAYSDQPVPMPTRLHHLSGWIAANWASPHAIWWAAGRGALNPDLLSRIEHAARTDQSDAPLARQAWSLIEEACTFPDDEITRDWYALEARIDRERWTRANLRAFGRVVRPKLEMRRPYWRDFSAEPSRLTDLVNIEIKWFKRCERLPRLGGDALAPVIAEVREALRIGASLLTDLDPHERTPTLHPSKGRGEPVMGNSGQFFLFFAGLFETLAKQDAAAARHEWQTWPPNEPFFFDKLRLWAWTNPALATGAEVAAGVAALSDRSFWSRSMQRELLWLLRARWSELAQGDREAIETRIMSGRGKLQREDDAAHKRAVVANTVERLGWLADNGCALSNRAQTVLEELAAETGEERAGLSNDADFAPQSYTGWVKTITDASNVIELRAIEVIAQCRALEGERDIYTFERHDPFLGVVQQKPLLALRALSLAAKKADYPQDYWDDLLRHWPQTASSRACWLLGQRLCAMPASAIVALRSTTAEWLKDAHERMDRYRAQTSLAVWDRLFSAFADGGAKAESDLLSGADDTFDSAFMAPVGRLTNTLLNLLNALKLKPGSSMPHAFASRLETALSVPGPGGAHAAAFCGAGFHWLGTVTPDWVAANLLPRFDLSHPHAVAIWDGLFNTDRPPQGAWFAKLKPSFLAALRDAALWDEREGARRLGQLLCHVVLVSTPRRQLLSAQEARAALQSTTETVREAALDLLQQFAAKPNGWRHYGARFLNEIWPLELALQTQRTARAWLEIALSAQGSFPEIARALIASPALVVVDELDMFAWSIRGEHEQQPFAKLYPEAALALLDAVVGERRPYEMDRVLDMMAEAEPGLHQDRRWLRLRLGRAA